MGSRSFLTDSLGPTLAALSLLAASASGQDLVRGHLLTFNDNGAWSWFQDERAVVDRFTSKILVGSCADSSGLGGSARGGDVDVATLDLAAGRITQFELHDRLEGDDHDSPALWVRPDGRYVAMYARHNTDYASRWRVSSRAGNATAWSAEAGLTLAGRVTYSNLHHVENDRGRTVNFTRAVNFDPNVMVSDDLGATWKWAGKLLTEGGGGDRPYVRYTSDGRKRVDLITTERHPRDYDNSIYHGYVEGGRLLDSFGKVVDSNILDPNGVPPSRLSLVFQAGTRSNNVAMHRAWTIDIALDKNERPRVLFQARANNSASDHRLFYARWTGSAWVWFEVCRMGAGLYSSEGDYTGLAALHPDDDDVIYVSTAIDPRNNAGLAHHEIFQGVTSDGGKTWTFTPITERSTVDNLRPIVPAWGPGRTALLWFRGLYTTYRDFDTAVVGTIDAPELRIGKARYFDATRSNTTLASGATFSPTGPSASQGARDGKWHERTGFGNGGQVLTSDERGDEDVPALRTRVTGISPGRYDVFVYFWTNPNNSWRLRAGLTATSLMNFTKEGAEAATASDFSSPGVVLSGPTVVLYKVWLGRTDIDSSQRVDVYIDDFASGQSSATRTWYDGIGLAPTACEASVIHAGAGCGGDPTLDTSGLPRLGRSFSLTIHNGKPNGFGVLVLGFGQLEPFDLTVYGFGGCRLYPLLVNVLPVGPISSRGTSPPFSIAIPNATWLMCIRMNLQGLVAHTSAVQLTPAVVAQLGS